MTLRSLPPRGAVAFGARSRVVQAATTLTQPQLPPLIPRHILVHLHGGDDGCGVWMVMHMGQRLAGMKRKTRAGIASRTGRQHARNRAAAAPHYHPSHLCGAEVEEQQQAAKHKANRLIQCPCGCLIHYCRRQVSHWLSQCRRCCCCGGGWQEYHCRCRCRCCSRRYSCCRRSALPPRAPRRTCYQAVPLSSAGSVRGSGREAGLAMRQDGRGHRLLCDHAGCHGVYRRTHVYR